MIKVKIVMLVFCINFITLLEESGTKVINLSQNHNTQLYIIYKVIRYL